MVAALCIRSSGLISASERIIATLIRFFQEVSSGCGGGELRGGMLGGTAQGGIGFGIKQGGAEQYYARVGLFFWWDPHGVRISVGS